MARHERVNQTPGAAGPLPAADPRCEELHRAQMGRQGPALAISSRGAACSQGKADGTWERAPGSLGWLAFCTRQREGLLPKGGTHLAPEQGPRWAGHSGLRHSQEGEGAGKR